MLHLKDSQVQINIVGALSSSMSKFPAIQKINLAHGTPYSAFFSPKPSTSKRIWLTNFTKLIENSAAAENVNIYHSISVKFHFRKVLFYKRKSCFCLTVLYYPMRSDLVQSNLLKQKEIYRSTSQFLLTTVRQTNFEIVSNK